MEIAVTLLPLPRAPLALLIAFAAACGGCSRPQPTKKSEPASTREAQPEFAREAGLDGIQATLYREGGGPKLESVANRNDATVRLLDQFFNANWKTLGLSSPSDHFPLTPVSVIEEAKDAPPDEKPSAS
jgi:hypothetical protein